MSAPLVSVETDLSNGIAAILEAANVAKPGATTGAAIVIRELNPSPDRGVAIVVGGVSDNARLGFGRRTVQLRFRGLKDSRDVDALAQQAFGVLHGIGGKVMGGIVLAHLFRTSFVSLGRDSNLRWERSDNYVADVTYPATVGQAD